MNYKSELAKKFNSKEHYKELMLAEGRRIKDLEEDLKDRKCYLSNLGRQYRAADH